MISAYQLDQELASDPQFRTLCALAMRMIAAALGERPSAPFDEILKYHMRPLFEMLQDQPPAKVTVPNSVRLTVAGHRATGELKLRNGEQYSRLLRVRVEWDEPGPDTPYLTMLGDNYFDLLPGEAKEVPIDARLPEGAHRGAQGILVVEGSNVSAVKVALSVVLP